MKTVFSNKQPIHTWAQQNQPHGRSSGMRFDKGLLFSYATPIANFVENKSGQRACLITTVNYSITTSSKHMPRSYDISGAPVFHVRFVGDESGRAPRVHMDYPGLASPDFHKANLKDYAARYDAALVNMLRSRTRQGMYHGEANRTIEEARKYAEFFGLKFSGKDSREISPELLAELKEREARNAEKKREADKKRKAKEAKQFADDSAKWLAGELYSMPNAMAGDTLLRVRGENIETSRGATFPIGHAVKAFALIQTVMKAGEAWQRNGKTLHLGNFQVDRIEPNGTVKAGCHTVQYSAIEFVAKQLKLI